MAYPSREAVIESCLEGCSKSGKEEVLSALKNGFLRVDTRKKRILNAYNQITEKLDMPRVMISKCRSFFNVQIDCGTQRSISDNKLKELREILEIDKWSCRKRFKVLGKDGISVEVSHIEIVEKIVEIFYEQEEIPKGHIHEYDGTIVLNLDKTPSPNLSSLADLQKNTRSVFASISESFLPQMEGFQNSTKELSKVLGQFAKRMNNYYIAQFAEIGKSLERILSAIDAHWEETRPKLQEANLWITPNMSTELIQEVDEVCRKPESQPHDVQEVFIRHYSQDGCALLKETINRWKKIPCFYGRMETIRDALDAHIHRKFTLSIPTLLPLIEGIACEYTSKKAGSSSKLLKEIIEDESYTTFLPSVSKQLFLSLIDNIVFFGNIGDELTMEKYPKFLIENGVKESECLNRHAILHGIQKNYASEINSLKVFLILDMLSILTPKTN